MATLACKLKPSSTTAPSSRGGASTPPGPSWSERGSSRKACTAPRCIAIDAHASSDVCSAGSWEAASSSAQPKSLRFASQASARRRTRRTTSASSSRVGGGAAWKRTRPCSSLEKTPSSSIEWKWTWRLTDDPNLCVRDRAGGRVAEPMALRPRPVAREDNEQARERREHIGAERRERAKLEGQRQDPLAHRHRGEHSIDQVRRDVCHAPAGAGPLQGAFPVQVSFVGVPGQSGPRTI